MKAVRKWKERCNSLFRALPTSDRLPRAGASRPFGRVGDQSPTEPRAKATKLRMVDLQIKKATLDAKLAKQAHDRGDDMEDGQGHAVDRTQLLQEILGRNTHEKE